ncbi:MAG: DUF362 domain-containing protein [Deltaproteobacteria bacterium]|nr:DUF362 domain-containing protein [Deltaproteobacteria bacterium]
MLSRRSILKTFGVFLLLLFSGERGALAQFLFRPSKKMAPRLSRNRFMEGGKALVGISGSGTVEDKIREAVSLAGGFEKLGLAGKTVLVKPNVVSGEDSPATTNPEVVAALVRILYGFGAKKVYVGDMSAFSTLSTIRNMRKNGIKKAAEENGAEVVVFEDYGWAEVDLPKARYIKSAYVTEWIYKPDIIVNLPVIKTHRSASYSIALKNFIGCTHLRQRPYIIDSSHWEELIADFNLAYSPDLNIVDGTVSMIEGGPWSGTPAHTGIIIASGDRVGADIAGLGVIKSFGRWEMVAGKDIWEQRQIKSAVELGVGAGAGSIMIRAGSGDERFKGLIKNVIEYAAGAEKA